MKNSSKWNLFFSFLEITGSIAIVIAALLHLHNLPSTNDIGLMEWIFQVGLVLLVSVEIGLKGINSGFDDLKKVKWKKNRKVYK